MNLISFIMATIGNYCCFECPYYKVGYCIQEDCPLWVIETTIENMVDYADNSIGSRSEEDCT